MKKLLDNEDGTAYGLLIIASFIFLGGTIYIVFLPMFNKFIGIFNTFIAQGMISQDTANAFNFNVLVIASMTIFMILGVAAWGITRALEKRDGIQ
jgi:Sec-independent protein secretion pathway component TatC